MLAQGGFEDRIVRAIRVEQRVNARPMNRADGGRELPRIMA